MYIFPYFFLSTSTLFFILFLLLEARIQSDLGEYSQRKEEAVAWMPSACTTVRGPAENQMVVFFCLSILEWCQSHPNAHFALYANDGGERGLFCSREALLWVAVLFKNTNTMWPREHVAKKKTYCSWYFLLDRSNEPTPTAGGEVLRKTKPSSTT